MTAPGQARAYCVTMRMSRICPTSPGSGAKSAGGAWEHPNTNIVKRRRGGTLHVVVVGFMDSPPSRASPSRSRRSAPARSPLRAPRRPPARTRASDRPWAGTGSSCRRARRPRCPGRGATWAGVGGRAVHRGSRPGTRPDQGGGRAGRRGWLRCSAPPSGSRGELQRRSGCTPQEPIGASGASLDVSWVPPSCGRTQDVKWGWFRQLAAGVRAPHSGGAGRGKREGYAMEKAGYGLIETIRVREGRIPFLERHLARLARSLSGLGLPNPSQDVGALVQPFAGTDDAVLRVEVCDARATVTVRELPALEPPAVITASEPHQPYPHKITVRDCFVDAAREAEVAEADDALLLTHDGLVAEGTVWTLFWWDGDVLRTPALDVGILPGIGRARVLEVAGAGVVEGRHPRPALAGKSLFLTNAVRGVIPVASLDGAPSPADERTAGLAKRFWPGPPCARPRARASARR